ncbi:MAG: hypothetical protein EU551_03000 [Promethearchaeota archaeon]|nr:MAG: hypothetical protein EU551_03000 [Candidatus Lokiarchaeota archaeon]
MEVYEVLETGETEFLNVNTIQDALSAKKVIIILDHEKKTVYIHVGSEATTRLKFSSARSSRRILQERNLAYRVKTVDEHDLPSWFEGIKEKVVRSNIRKEPPPLEILKILRKIEKSEPINGYNSEAAVIKNKFFKLQEKSTTIMGKDHSVEKFEQVQNLPEGFYLLPGDYKTRLYIEKGKVMGIELLKGNNKSES